MKKFFIMTIATISCSIFWAQEYEPIAAKEIIKVDTFFNEYFIEDKYQWLEKLDKEETKEWIKAQNELAKSYLSTCSNKTNSFSAIDKYAYAKHDIPQKKGKYYFKYAYYNNLGVPALFYQSSLNAKLEKLVDPNYISSKDKITLRKYSVSKDSKYLAYQFSRNGSDWVEIKVVSLRNGIHKKDHLEGLKFSPIAWLGDGFFYSTVSQVGEFGKTLGPRVFYHKIGTPQKEDKLIFERKNNPLIRFHYQTTSDERFFVLKEINEQANKKNIYFIDYHVEQPQLKPLLINVKKGAAILDSKDGKFIAVTSHGSNNRSIVEIDPANPYNWREIVSEFSEAILLKALSFPDRIVAVYQIGAHPHISFFDYSGNVLYNLELQVATSVGEFSLGDSEEELFFYSTSYTQPPVVYKLNIKTFKLELAQQTSVTFDFKNIEYKETEYLSKDSVLIPMTFVYEKGLKLDGNNPTILKAYGGFGIIAKPSFDPGIVHFIKNGGIFVFAGIRGGGDKGSEWANAGRGDNKKNSFDDFISAAEFLIAKKYTKPEKLAITGGSNGGLVVAVAAIQRPDLFKVVVPVVAPLDMLRFEKFTVGHFHTDEYGTVKNKASFERLHGYSPYHNIQEDFNYPAILIVTSDNDDRVPPFHSYKFVARLQNRSAQKSPVILKIEQNSGHYGASTLFSNIRAKADTYGFIMNEIMKN